MVGKKSDVITEGTLRIMAKDLKVCERTKTSWIESSKEFPDAIHVVQLFKAHDNIDCLVD